MSGPRHDRALLEGGKVNFTEPPENMSTIRVLGRDVRVEYHPGLTLLGIMGTYAHDGTFEPLVVRLREWNERVFLHEILHLLMGYPHLFDTSDPNPDYPLTEWTVGLIEDALWDLGWRWHGDQQPSDKWPVCKHGTSVCPACGEGPFTRPLGHSESSVSTRQLAPLRPHRPKETRHE